MPYLTLWPWLSWLAHTACEVGVASLLLQTGLWRQFRSVLAYLCARSCRDLILVGISLYLSEPHKSWWYFYAYYLGSLVISITELAVIVELSSDFFSSREMRFTVQTTVCLLGAGYLFGSLLFSFSGPLLFDEWIVRFCVGANRAAAFAWLAVFLCVVFLVRWLRLEWPEDALGMAIGYALVAIGEVSTSWLIGIYAPKYLGYVDAVFYLACLIVWMLTLVRSVRLCPVVTEPVKV